MGDINTLKDALHKIKGELKEEKNPASEPVRQKEIEHALSTIMNNADLAKMYNDAAGMGSQNLQSSLPMLKLHITNKSTGNMLLDGKEPNNGWFFHTKTQEQFESPIVHILTVSKGFRAEGMVDKNTGEKGGEKFNQIIGGVLVDHGDAKPFMMYVTGLKLQPLWDFGKEISQYTHAVPVSIPMFALTVKLTTKKVDSKFGPVMVVNFEVVRTADGDPVVITSPKEFMFLKNMVTSMEQTINGLINTKTSSGLVEVPTTDSAGNEIKDIVIPDDNEKGEMPF